MFEKIGIGLRFLGLATMLTSVILMFAIQVWTIDSPHKVLIATNELGEHEAELYGLASILPITIFIAAEYMMLLADRQLTKKRDT